MARPNVGGLVSRVGMATSSSPAQKHSQHSAVHSTRARRISSVTPRLSKTTRSSTTTVSVKLPGGSSSSGSISNEYCCSTTGSATTNSETSGGNQLVGSSL